MTQQPVIIREIVGVADPNNSTAAIPNTLKVNSDGSINVDASGSSFSVGATATAAAPTYIEGSTDALSQDLSGRLRTVSTPIKASSMVPTQVTVPATTNGILILAANAVRLGATVSNPGSVTVYIGSAATGLTVSNGFGIPPGSSYNIDEPLYMGAIYGIVAANTQVVTIVELS